MRQTFIGLVLWTGVLSSGAAAEVTSTLGVDLTSGVQAEAARQPVETDPAATAETPPADDGTSDGAPVAPGLGFGRAGARLWGVGAGYMNDFEDNQAGEVHFGYSHFIADDLEFNLELTAWYFDQEGENTGALSPIMNFRWHFLHDETYNWTIFGEAGIGLLFAFDNVPDGGTGFNFLPRVGFGFTKQLDDAGTRLVLGARWQHISNGRIEGDDRNPGRDSIMGYAGVMFPF